MRKFILFLLLLLLFVSGCSSNNEPVAKEEKKEPESTNTEVALEIPEYSGPDSEFPNTYPEPDPMPDKGYVIGFMNATAANAQFIATQEAFVREAERLGAEVVVKDDQLDVNKQISNMEQLIAQGVDAIIYYPLDPKATVNIVKKAKDAGIPVFAQDQTATPEEDPGQIISQIWQGRDTSAYYAVATVAAMKPNANVIGVGLNVPVPSIMFLMEQIETYAKEFGLNWVAKQDSESDDASGGQAVVSQMLASNQEVDAIIAYNDPNAQGAFLAAKERGLKDVITAGFNGGSDAFQAIESGRQTISVKYDAVEIGKQFAKGAFGYISGQVTDADLPKVVVVPPQLITPENIDEVNTWEEDLK